MFLEKIQQLARLARSFGRANQPAEEPDISKELEREMLWDRILTYDWQPVRMTAAHGGYFSTSYVFLDDVDALGEEMLKRYLTEAGFVEGSDFVEKISSAASPKQERENARLDALWEVGEDVRKGSIGAVRAIALVSPRARDIFNEKKGSRDAVKLAARGTIESEGQTL